MELSPSDYDYDEVAKLIGYKPNNWQREVEAVDARFKTITVGRRGGKTLYVVRSPKDGLIKDLFTPNQRVWIVAPTYDLTKRVWDDFFNMCLKYFPREFFIKLNNTKGNYLIETFAGTIIEAKSADNPENLIGVGLTKLIIDEASRVKEKAWYQALRPTLADFKGKAIFISTPRGKNWFYDIYRQGAVHNDRYASFHFTSYDNEFIAREEIDDMAKDMPEFEYNQEILAQFTENAEQIFDLDKIHRMQEYAPKGDGIRTMGIDLGKGLSYTVITGLEDGKCFRFERFKTSWIETIKRIEEIYHEDNPHFIRVDATGKGDPVVEQLEMEGGIPVDPFVFSVVSKKQLLDKASLAIEKGLIHLPKDEEIIYKEMEAFGREKLESGNVVYRPLKKMTDDVVMSVALAIWDMDLGEERKASTGAIAFPVIDNN